MSEVLRCWLRKNYNVDRFGEPTWQTVVKVVAQPAAGNNCALALRLAEKHSGNAYTLVMLHNYISVIKNSPGVCGR